MFQLAYPKGVLVDGSRRSALDLCLGYRRKWPPEEAEETLLLPESLNITYSRRALG